MEGRGNPPQTQPRHIRCNGARYNTQTKGGKCACGRRRKRVQVSRRLANTFSSLLNKSRDARLELQSTAF